MAFSEDQIVVIQSKIPDTITFTTKNSDTVLVGDIVGTLVSDNVSTVLSSSINTHLVVSQGAPGPIGPTGITEEDMVFSKRIDFITDNEMYKAEATVGSLNSAASWRIRKITIALDSDIIETWADGNALFDKVWDNRLSYTYS
jgi:hypothetical protein